MLTNNFRKLMFNIVFGGSAGSPPYDFTTYPTVINLSGDSRMLWESSDKQNWNTNYYDATINSLSTISTTPTNGLGYIILGSGTTKPTADDYCLESQITENLSCDTVSVSRKSSSAKLYTAIFSNSGSSNITVNEVGYVSRIVWTVETDEFDNFLMDRTVLETPITIPAGESRTVTYELSF